MTVNYSANPPPISTPMQEGGRKVPKVWEAWFNNAFQILRQLQGYIPDSVVPVINGGTGLTSGTSGGILGFIASTTIVSSAVLANHGLVVGGGVGATPSTPVGLGSTTQVLHGNASGNPSWGQVSLTADITGTLAVGNGGLGITSGTSGGILGFTGSSTIASSGLLTANALVLGGGAGATPSTPVGLGTSTTVLHGNASGVPSWGAVALGTDVSGTLQAAQFPALTGDITTSAGSLSTTLATVATPGTSTKVTYNAKGLVTSGAAAALASSDFANQGTTTTVLHGNAAGNPSWAAVSLTADVSGVLPLANGGTSANLTASNGGIVYSGSSALAVLSGTATANQIVLSGSGSAPSWSTATYPGTVTANQVLRATGTNAIGASSGLTYDGSTLSATGDLSVSGALNTGNPTGGTAASWKLGSRGTATVALDTAHYVQIDIGGTAYKLGLVS